MSDNAEISTTLATQGQDIPGASPVTPDQAVAICMTAFKRAHDSALAKGKSDWDSEKAGRFAFRLAMPSMGTLEGVQAFIACVTRGIHLDMWNMQEPMQLFYAAQVAISAHRREGGSKREAGKK